MDASRAPANESSTTCSTLSGTMSLCTYTHQMLPIAGACSCGMHKEGWAMAYVVCMGCDAPQVTNADSCSWQDDIMSIMPHLSIVSIMTFVCNGPLQGWSSCN